VIRIPENPRARSDEQREVGPGFWTVRPRLADVLLEFRVIRTELRETWTELQETRIKL
jgi:hypothetical protein